MFFYGMKEKTITGSAMNGDKCPNCFNQQYLSYAVIKYFHLYWIPTLPTKKSVGLLCVGCNSTIPGKDLPGAQSAQLKSSLITRDKLMPLFTGSILAGFAVFAIVCASLWMNGKESQYLQNPAVNDLYVADFAKVFEDDIGSMRYGVMRVASVAGDQVELEVGQTVYNRSSGARSDVTSAAATLPSYYAKDHFTTDLAHLKSWDDAGGIRSVHRN